MADFCPICRGLRCFKLKRVGVVGHLYYLSVGEGELAGHVRTCSDCNVDLDAKPETYLGIHPHKLPPEELAAITNPDWRVIHADRLRLEEAFAADPASLSPQERSFLLQEPFHLLAPKAEERFRSSHFDLRTLLAIVGWIVLLVLAGALGKAVPAAEDAAFLIAFVAGIALVSRQVTQIKHLWFRDAVFPTLVPALRPLKPSSSEIEGVLAELKRRGEQIGKKLDPERLISALAAAPMPLAPLAAATLAPPPPAAPALTPAPSADPVTPPATSQESASAPAAVARQPGLKLKYGGIRLRFTAADGEIMIGRAPDANIVVSEQHVSRHHATIIWDAFGNPLLVNLSQIGTSLQVNGQAPQTVDSSTRLTGEGRIGLSGEFAFAEQHGILVVYEVKGGPAP